MRWDHGFNDVAIKALRAALQSIRAISSINSLTLSTFSDTHCPTPDKIVTLLAKKKNKETQSKAKHSKDTVKQSRGSAQHPPMEDLSDHTIVAQDNFKDEATYESIFVSS